MNSSVTNKKCFKVKDLKLSRVLIVQNNVYAAVHGAMGEDRLQETCKKCLRHLIYARACVNKDFVPNGSIGHIEQARALCYNTFLNAIYAEIS